MPKYTIVPGTEVPQTPFYYYDLDLLRRTLKIGRASCRERV